MSAGGFNEHNRCSSIGNLEMLGVEWETQKQLCGGKCWKLQAEAEMGLLHLQGEKKQKNLDLTLCRNTKHKPSRILEHFPMSKLNPRINNC